MQTKDGIEYQNGMTLYDYDYLNDMDVLPEILEYPGTYMGDDGYPWHQPEECAPSSLNAVDQMYGSKLTLLKMCRDILEQTIKNEQQRLQWHNEEIARLQDANV